MRRRPINPADLRAARLALAGGLLALGLYLAHVAHLDVRLGLGSGEIEGEAVLMEPVVTPIRARPVLWVFGRNGRRLGFRYWKEGMASRILAVARQAGAEPRPALGARAWRSPPPLTAFGVERSFRKWDRFVLRVRYAGLGRRIITGFEVP